MELHFLILDSKLLFTAKSAFPSGCVFQIYQIGFDALGKYNYRDAHFTAAEVMAHKLSDLCKVTGQISRDSENQNSGSLAQFGEHVGIDIIGAQMLMSS